MFPVQRCCCVTLQLGSGVGRQRLSRLAVHCVAHIVVGALDPVPSKLRQEDERKGAFSTQYLFQKRKQTSDVQQEKTAKKETSVKGKVEKKKNVTATQSTSWTLGYGM